MRELLVTVYHTETPTLVFHTVPAMHMYAADYYIRSTRIELSYNRKFLCSRYILGVTVENLL